jgi:hypothetical protein
MNWPRAMKAKMTNLRPSDMEAMGERGGIKAGWTPAVVTLQAILEPPSTRRVWPVMKKPASETGEFVCMTSII